VEITALRFFICVFHFKQLGSLGLDWLTKEHTEGAGVREEKVKEVEVEGEDDVKAIELKRHYEILCRYC
jgi:hypothetical protein